MKKLLKTIGTVAASFVEQNPNLLEYIRTHHFKGKVIVVSKLQEIFCQKMNLSQMLKESSIN